MFESKDRPDESPRHRHAEIRRARPAGQGDRGRAEIARGRGRRERAPGQGVRHRDRGWRCRQGRGDAEGGGREAARQHGDREFRVETSPERQARCSAGHDRLRIVTLALLPPRVRLRPAAASARHDPGRTTAGTTSSDAPPVAIWTRLALRSAALRRQMFLCQQDSCDPPPASATASMRGQYDDSGAFQARAGNRREALERTRAGVERESRSRYRRRRRRPVAAHVQEPACRHRPTDRRNIDERAAARRALSAADAVRSRSEAAERQNYRCSASRCCSINPAADKPRAIAPSMIVLCCAWRPEASAPTGPAMRLVAIALLLFLSAPSAVADDVPARACGAGPRPNGRS